MIACDGQSWRSPRVFPSPRTSVELDLRDRTIKADAGKILEHPKGSRGPEYSEARESKSIASKTGCSHFGMGSLAVVELLTL